MQQRPVPRKDRELQYVWHRNGGSSELTTPINDTTGLGGSILLATN